MPVRGICAEVPFFKPFKTWMSGIVLAIRLAGCDRPSQKCTSPKRPDVAKLPGTKRFSPSRCEPRPDGFVRQKHFSAQRRNKRAVKLLIGCKISFGIVHFLYLDDLKPAFPK
jgi:hypothetical protein